MTIDDERELIYCCTPRDLADIETNVFRRMDGSLAEAEKRWPTHALVPVGSLALAERDMGTGSLFVLLIPPPHLQRFVFAGPWLDQNRSHVIEVGRCLVNRGTILGARMWCCASSDKTPAFVDWADQVFTATRSLLRRSESHGVWLGKDAGDALRAGSLRAA